MKHPTLEQLETSLKTISDSPKNQSTLALIVTRPSEGERKIHETCEFTIHGGLKGDNWATECWKKLSNGSPDPVVQITLMNTRLLNAICLDESRWPLAGDQLYTELNLSKENLPTGTQLSVGEAILEITPEPHTGCSQFAERFGKDALKFVASPTGLEMNLRGTYAKVIQDGSITKGDTVKKLLD